MLIRLAVFAVVLTACGAAVDGSTTDLEDIPHVSVEEFQAHLAGLDVPAVVNVWASWCLPCRAEAPLLDAAAIEYGDRIEFIGIDVADEQSAAKAFLGEFGLDGLDQYFDPDRAIPNSLAGFGTPITFFFGPHGELIRTHNGVIDERTLALNIDDLIRTGS
jgi:cytochrome c biogenesis protein CcmG/thiol:disulfide interchange protein DsbE